MRTEIKNKPSKKTPPQESGLLLKCSPSHDSGIVSADRGGAYFMTYAEQLKSPKWQKKRLEIMERDCFQCKNCYSKDKQLHVHHIFYLSNTKAWEYPDNFYITLCDDCHKLIKNRTEYLFKTIVNYAGNFMRGELIDYIGALCLSSQISNDQIVANNNFMDLNHSTLFEDE